MPSALPEGWPRLSAAIVYEDVRAAITFLETAFGFETRTKIEGPDGRIEHSELVCEGALVMVAGANERPGLVCRSPKSAGGVTAGFYMYVDDVDAHCERARAAGAKIITEPLTKSYGDRNYEALDLEGHWWSFGQRVDDDAWQRETELHNKA